MATNDVPRLDWASKPKTVERVALPFQIVETINESRATREAHRGSLFGSKASEAADGWRNKLIWGDNKLVMGSLLADYAGQIKLIYIDPPFATGDDFTLRVEVGDTDVRTAAGCVVGLRLPDPMPSCAGDLPRGPGWSFEFEVGRLPRHSLVSTEDGRVVGGPALKRTG